MIFKLILILEILITKFSLVKVQLTLFFVQTGKTPLKFKILNEILKLTYIHDF